MIALFDKWTLRRAQKIQEKQKAAEKSTAEYKDAEYKKIRNTVSEAKAILMSNLESIEEAMMKKDAHITEGCIAILNRYSIFGNPNNVNNGWDGGPNSFLRHAKPKDLESPVQVFIKKIYVDWSFAEEKIEQWVERRDHTSLESMINNGSLWQTYKNWYDHMTPTQMPWKSTYGLYKTATFDLINCEFKPIWGLNIESFLKAGTPEAEETRSVWFEEIKIEKDRQELDKRLKALESRKREIEEKYHNIKYVN